jgi:hypothetical protein
MVRVPTCLAIHSNHSLRPDRVLDSHSRPTAERQRFRYCQLSRERASAAHGAHLACNMV